MPQHGTLDQCLGLPTHEFTNETPQGWMFEKLPITIVGVNVVEQARNFVGRCAAYTLESECVILRIEDAVARRGRGLENASGGQLIEVAIRLLVYRFQSVGCWKLREISSGKQVLTVPSYQVHRSEE